MVKNNITPQEAVDILNELLVVDKNAVSTMVMSRVVCNKLLAAHPTVQVFVGGGATSVSMLGILNGMFGVYDDGPKKGHGPIKAVYDDGNTAWGRPDRFELNRNE